MNNESKEISVRNQWIDIVKSVAIISVVVGHALNTNNYFDAGIDEIRKFIYTYHLVVLFWITGYCWKRKNLSEFITKLKKTYTRYVPYAIGSFLLIPLWVRMGVVDPCRLSIKGIIYDISKILMFQVTRGIFMGALWFVTWKTVTEILLYIIEKNSAKTNWKCCWMCVGEAAIIGLILTLEYRPGNYYFNVALLMIPIIIIGRKCKKHFDCIEQRIDGWWFVPSGVILGYSTNIQGLEVGLSRGEIYGGLLFYPVSILGIIWCLSLSKLINTLWLNRAMAYISRNSMYLMIWHVVSFKLLDGLIAV